MTASLNVRFHARAYISVSMLTLQNTTPYRKMWSEDDRAKGHEIALPLPTRSYRDDDAASLREGFESEYRRLYSRVIPGVEVEFLSWVLLLSAPIPTRPKDLVRSCDGGPWHQGGLVDPRDRDRCFFPAR